MRGAPRGCDDSQASPIGPHESHGPACAFTSRHASVRPSSRLESWCHHAQSPRGQSPFQRTAIPRALRYGAVLGAVGSAAATSGGQALAADPSTLLVYVMDIYDPASYAYLPSVSVVLQAAHPLVDVEVVQTGRYAAVSPAACLIALLAAGEVPVPTVLAAAQQEYFVRGRRLDTPGVLRSVADRLGLDGPAVELFAASRRARELAVEDFEVARELDVGGGPLLLASQGERVFEFDGPGASGDRLVDQFRSVLARP